MKHTNSLKKSNLIQLGYLLLIVISLNIIGAFLFARFDLTADKRYSLSESTKKQLKELDDIVYFQVYLEGDYPAGFKRLAKETREMLDEFRMYSDNIQYQFVNPAEGADQKEVANRYKELVNKGLQPTQIQIKDADSYKTQNIFPAALVSYKQRELPVQLMVSRLNTPPEEVLNYSIESLEYNLINVIRKLTTNKKKKVAFTTGHGELNDMDISAAAYALSEHYNVERVLLDEQLKTLRITEEDSTGKITVANRFDALIVARPTQPFTEKEVFLLDQFVMRGGKILWYLDPVMASIDSLQKAPEMPTIAYNLNLEELLFSYGVRFNTDLLLDLNALPIVVNTGRLANNTPQQQMIPFFYFPILTPTSNHAIVKNLNAIKTEFVSSIDLVGNKSLQKTVLLTTSKYTKRQLVPNIVSLNVLRYKPDPREYNQSYKTVAALVEGKFVSMYSGRMPVQLDTAQEIQFLTESPASKMIFVADGDMLKNQNSQGQPLELGFDKYTQTLFGNKDFLLNCVDYLCGDEELLQVRTRELKLRLLDSTKTERQNTTFQVLNVVLPLGIIAIIGVVLIVIRKRKYGKLPNKGR